MQSAEGFATWYSTQSCQREGTSGIYTASGERYDETAFTCAVRSRDFGSFYGVTNLKNGRYLVCRQNDFGPGKKATKNGVIIDLTPYAFDALGGKRGKNSGKIKVRVEKVNL